MINVYSKNTTVFNNNGLATLIPTSCEFSPSINGGWTFVMEHPFDTENNRHNHLVKNNILRVTGIDCIREWDNPEQMFRIYDTKKSLESITVIAFPLGMEAQYDAMIEELELKNKTGIQAASELDSYVKNHDSNNKYTISSNVSKTSSSRWENTNLIAAISGSDDDSFVNKWGGEVIYDNYKIKIRSICGDQEHARSYPIRYGRNLTGLVHEEDMSSVITRLYPISSDDVRLNTWTDVTDQGGSTYVDSNTGRASDYPFIRAQFVEVKYSLIDTDEKSISQTHTQTVAWETGIVNTTRSIASALWDTVKNDLTNTYCAAYVKTLLNGDNGIIKYLQNRYVFAHKNWQSFTKSCIKQGVEWIKSDELPNWEWHEDTSVTPHAWWYGDNSVDPAVSYAKNCYVKIGKYWEYFNEDGYWLDYKRLPDADMEWHEAKDGSGRKWFGYKKGYYAHNEYVYVTVDGQMKEWFYDSDGWYDADSSGDSNMGWHGDASSGIWFGEEGATSEDKSKYIHDRWAWIDGTYYWFDQYGYTDADPAHSMPDYPWGDQTSEEGKSWFGNTDDSLGSVYLANQWAKISDAPNNIDSDYCYFDNDGWLIDMAQKESDIIAWFANTVYDGTINYVKTQLTSAYTLLFSLMTDWCNTQFANGLDAPTVNVTVDLIDLSNTNEYSEYAKLERIALGDSVLVIGKDGSQYEERVVGLTYDCIRGYNTKVEIGALSKSVGQVLSSSFKSTADEQKLIAGDNVLIDGKVISVGDYVSRVVGITDVLLNDSSITNGNLASFGIQAGENISISRDGNTLTINAIGGGGDVSLYHGIDIPDNSLGDDKDIYLQMESTVGNLLSFDASNSGTSITNYSATETNRKWDITATFLDNWEYHSFNIYSLQNLTVGKKYAISFDFQNDGTPPLYGKGELFGLTLQHINRPIDMRNWSSDLVENGEFKYFEDSYYGEWWYQSFPNDTKRVHYEFEFTARQTTEYIGFYGDRTSGNLTCSLYELCVGEREEANEIKDVFYKINEEWLLYEAYESGDNITIVDGVISATDTDEISELEDVSLTNLADGEILKYNATTQKWENAEDSGGSEVEANPSGTATDTLTKLGIDGTVYEIQGGGGGGSTYFGVFVDADNVIQPFINITDTQIHTYTAIKDCAVAYYIPNDTNTDVYIKLDGIIVGGQYGQYINATSGIVYMKKGQVFSYQSTYTASSGAGYAVYGLQSGSEASYFQPIIYSTEEREVGVWTDNKPLYQKTWIFTSPITVNSNSWASSGITVADTKIETIASCKADNTDGQIMNYISATTDLGTQTYVMLFNSRTNANMQVKTLTLQYTKTTDTPTDAQYNALGVPMVHYTTDEQVIGTWMGETLYRRVYDFSNNPINVPTGSWLKVANEWQIMPIRGTVIIPSSRASFEVAVYCDDNDGLYIQSWLAYSNVKYLIVEYTKTS